MRSLPVDSALEQAAMEAVDEEPQAQDEPMSPAVSNVTQEPDVEQGSQLGPDMTAYGYDPTEEELQVTSLKMDRALLEEMEKLVKLAEEAGESFSRESTAWFQGTGRRTSIWPPDLWTMTTNSQDASEYWEIGLYRLTQTCAILIGIPNTEITKVMEGGMCDIIELYGSLLSQLGGHWRQRFLPKQHYGLKMWDKHLTPEQAMRAAVQCSASEHAQEWARRMGKGVDDAIHAQAAYTYSDVAGEQWKTCWNHGDRKVPVRILIMGSSVKLGHTTSAEGFKKVMLERLGFAAEK